MNKKVKVLKPKYTVEYYDGSSSSQSNKRKSIVLDEDIQEIKFSVENKILQRKLTDMYTVCTKLMDENRMFKQLSRTLNEE